MRLRLQLRALAVLGIFLLTNPSLADDPDTMVASLNTAGFITAENNDGGTWEGSLGSALFGIPINNDSSFWFVVTGYPDFDYNGSHDEFGDYRVYVDIFNDFNEYEETYIFEDSLEPGDVDQFYMDGFNTFYSYDVIIDNTIGGAAAGGDFDSDGDVDGRDFLTWQRNPSIGSLSDWQTNYGSGVLNAFSVPEPAALLLVVSVCGVTLSARRQAESR